MAIDELAPGSSHGRAERETVAALDLKESA
jgi:hypothetical protein